MEDDSKKIAQETFDKLPEDIKEVIFSDDYQKILNDIVQKYNLTKEQSGKLEFETTMVLMGVNKRGYYPFNLESELSLGEDTAQNINEEIANTVFAEVGEQLDAMDAAEVGNEEELNKKIDYEEKKSEQEEENSENDITTENKTVNTGATSLTSLADRLKQASIATPTKRDYSLSKDSMSSNSDSNGSQSAHAIDPYHESIDNE